MRPALRFAPLALATVTALMTVDPPIAAQDRPNRRTLGGHSFITSSNVGDPFMGTYIRTTTGAGRALDLQVPVYDLDSNQIGTLSGNIAFVQLALAYQQRLAKWVVLRASVSGAARLGTNHVALLAEGAAAVYGGTFGATFRLAETERFLLSAIAEGRSNAIYAISPLTFVINAIEGGTADSTTGLLDKGDNWRLIGGLRTAYAFAPWIGIMALAEIGPATRFFEDESGDRNTGQFSLGGTISLDLKPGTNVPIGFAGSVLYQSESDRGDDLVGRQTLFGLGVFYTGRHDLTLGLETGFQRFDQRGLDSKINAVQIRLVLRYDF
jgi:hypothetical protein